MAQGGLRGPIDGTREASHLYNTLDKGLGFRV